MSHELAASIQVTLPDGPKEMAEALGTISTQWAEFLGLLEEAQRKPTATFSVHEMFPSKPGANNGAGTGRGRPKGSRNKTATPVGGEQASESAAE